MVAEIASPLSLEYQGKSLCKSLMESNQNVQLSRAGYVRWKSAKQQQHQKRDNRIIRWTSIEKKYRSREYGLNSGMKSQQVILFNNLDIFPMVCVV